MKKVRRKKTGEEKKAGKERLERSRLKSEPHFGETTVHCPNHSNWSLGTGGGRQVSKRKESRLGLEEMSRPNTGVAGLQEFH